MMQDLLQLCGKRKKKKITLCLNVDLSFSKVKGHSEKNVWDGKALL